MSPDSAAIIDHLLRLLREYVTDLEPYRAVELEALRTDKVLRRFVERTLQVAAECCLDLGNHIISARGLREPSGNRDVIRVLEEEGVLDPALAAKMSAMAGFRNVIVHGYARVDVEIVHAIVTRDVEDLHAFGRAIRSWLDTEGAR